MCVVGIGLVSSSTKVTKPQYASIVSQSYSASDSSNLAGRSLEEQQSVATATTLDPPVAAALTTPATPETSVGINKVSGNRTWSSGIQHIL